MGIVIRGYPAGQCCHATRRKITELDPRAGEDDKRLAPRAGEDDRSA